MGFRLPSIVRKSLSKGTVSDVPKGYLAVYVGDASKAKRFVIPVSFLNHPLFQELLSKAEEEFGFARLMGGLTIPCLEDVFMDLISRLNRIETH